MKGAEGDITSERRDGDRAARERFALEIAESNRRRGRVLLALSDGDVALSHAAPRLAMGLGISA